MWEKTFFLNNCVIEVCFLSLFVSDIREIILLH